MNQQKVTRNLTIIIAVSLAVIILEKLLRAASLGLSEPVGFFQMSWGLDKGVVLYLALMCSGMIGYEAYLLLKIFTRRFAKAF